jgi:polysaccharide export outer membrane protein
MIRSFLQILLFCVLAAGGVATAAKAPEVPKDLTDYIREARKLGLKDEVLRQNTIKAGWKAEVVDEAMHSVRPDQPAAPDSPAVESARPDRGVGEQYQIGAGDVLQITIWKEMDISVPSVAVRADGKIAMPLLKEVAVADLTPLQVEQIITERLKPFINSPDVSVIVREVHSKKIYLVGAVKKEGTIDLKYPMSILQALSEAGGVTEYAKRKKIYILRTENGKQFRFMFNYDAIIRGEQMEQNILVMPGDTIVVPH